MQSKARHCALIVFVFSLIINVSLGIPSRESSWFGDRLQFMCHCKQDRKCNEDGDCPDSECAKGWFGPQCQYYDLTQDPSMKFPPELDPLFDEDSAESCIPGSLFFLPKIITFPNKFRFTWMRLVITSGAYRFDDWGVFFLTNGLGGMTLATPKVRLKRIPISDNTMDIYGEFEDRIDQIEISFFSTLPQSGAELCSLHISGGRNVAIMQDTHQVSTFYTNMNSFAVNAVDGNRLADYGSRSCTHTRHNTDPAYWTLSFDWPVVVDRHVIYNRDEIETSIHKINLGCRLAYFTLTDYNEYDIQFTYNNTQKLPPAVIEIPLPKPVTITETEIRISKSFWPNGESPCWPGDALILTLCEVETYGDTQCEVGKWGRQCEKPCRCAGPYEQCYVATGMCSSGCKAGYRGPGCAQGTSVECPRDYFGSDCSQRCSANCLQDAGNQSSACDPLSGRCSHGCRAGYTGDSCEEECPDRQFGLRCSHQCSTNCGGADMLCNNEDGACLDGCQPGFTSRHCDKECPHGKFGHSCSQRCHGNCLEDANNQSSACHHQTGQCLHGCSAGYTGDTCQEDCPDGQFGSGCSYQCSINCGGADMLCDKEDGTCLDDCQPGYTSPHCEFECQHGYFGLGCSQRCSTNCLEDLIHHLSACHHQTGHCLHGCKAGYTGDTCQEECPGGQFGSGCLHYCSINCMGSDHWCDKDDGACLFGCRPGYTSYQCDKECPHGYFGQGCSQRCRTNCHKDVNNQTSSCHHQTGHCLHGCSAGYTGYNCQKAVPDVESPSLAVPVTVSVVLTSLLFLGAVLAYLGWRRCRLRGQYRPNMIWTTSPSSPVSDSSAVLWRGDPEMDGHDGQEALQTDTEGSNFSDKEDNSCGKLVQ